MQSSIGTVEEVYLQVIKIWQSHLKFEWLPYFLPCKSNSRKIFSEQAIQVLMSFRLIYWIRWLCHGTCRYFMSQFFVTYTLLLIQSIRIFVFCSTGAIFPIIFKPACTVQSAKLKLYTNLLLEVLLPSLIWFHKETGEKLLRSDS